MKKSWVLGLDKEAELDIRGGFEASLPIRKRLTVLLDAKIASAEKASIVDGSYESPNWAYKQADTVGYKRAMMEIISLLDIK